MQCKILRSVMRKTKIIGTIGPASNSYDVMKKLVTAGLNVVRINLSHAKIDDMEKILSNVKKLRKEMKVPLPIILDTRGPEVRVKTFENDSVQIKKGQIFTFTGRDIIGNSQEVSFNTPEIVHCIKTGNRILAVNGLLAFKVLEVNGLDVITKAMNSGVLSNRKSLSIPNIKYSTPYLNDQDKQDILWGIKNDIEWIAGSFVNGKEDVIALRSFIEKNGGDMKVISKIESSCGVKNLDEIIDASDGIMVARGDLGVEVPVEKLPELQKTIIKRSKEKGKAVITATEMLESMIYNNRATRAEVSDVANAVYDGTSAVMLSGETAMGKFPVQAVETMAKIARETEKHINYSKRFLSSNFKITNTTDVVSHSAVNASLIQNTKAIVVFSQSGTSAQMISRFRPFVSIIGATPNEKVYRQLELSWGVIPVLTSEYNSTDEMFKITNEIVKKKKFAKPKDTIVITCGTPKRNGCTNLIKIDTVK